MLGVCQLYRTAWTARDLRALRSGFGPARGSGYVQDRSWRMEP